MPIDIHLQPLDGSQWLFLGPEATAAPFLGSVVFTLFRREGKL